MVMVSTQTDRMSNFGLNYVSFLEDEIALEGLDGITLQALWLRLKQRPNFESSIALDEHSKAFLWDMICGDEEIFMYELPTPREELAIFNRYELMDPELGIVLEPSTEPIDIYPFHPIEDDKKGVRGSCKLYQERIDVTNTVFKKALKEVEEEYGEKLVLVASQMLRDKALNISTCIDKFYDLTLSQYILLERIGRSRQMGEITQGKVSLAAMGDNPKSMFYHRKRLLKLNLITKQPHQQKGCKGQTQNGSLLHLTRFYVERRSKFVMMIQRAVEILKAKSGSYSPYITVKAEMGMPETSCRKLFKSSEFQKYVKNVSVPYRQVYPDASLSEWRCKGKDAEKYVRIMELINPAIDPQDVCKVDDLGDDEDEEDSYPGILDQKRMVFKEGFLQQAYKIVEEAGPDGVSQSDMARVLGQTKLDSRTICRNLQRRNKVHSLMKDVGRQRVSRYVSNKYAHTGHLTQEFQKERQKMMAMIEESWVQDAVPSTSKEDAVKIVETNSMEGVEVNLEMMSSRNSASKGKNAPKSSSPSSSWKMEQKKQTSDESTNENKGFLSMLEDVQLTYSNQKRNSPHVTTRMMKRANMIIEAVRSIKVIDDAFKLQKMIVKAETDEGYAVKMDKKSLYRLLDKLARGGFLKNIIVKLKCADHVKILPFVVDPSITFESPHLKSAIEQQKLKFLTVKSEPKKDSSGSGENGKEPQQAKEEAAAEGTGKTGRQSDADSALKQTSVDASMLELKQMHQITARQKLSAAPAATTSENSSVEVAKKVQPARGSLGPKFVRMSELHELLFYLVYGYCGTEELDQEQAWLTIAKSSPDAQLDNEELSSYPTIYCAEVSWKMFIPPLPNHMISEAGWAFVCDILLRLPLCIFVRLVSVTYVTSDAEEYLAHPLKKYLLLKYLPPFIRQTLLQGRRYVTYVMDLISRLCYVGLVQYGHQIMKEKDQVFIYLNRRASLIDTTTSSPGYHQISADKEYVRKEYYFSCMQDIHQYWYDMWTISMHTPLGGHNCMQGKKITIQILDRKPQILDTIKPRATLEAPARDTGSIPGDGRGACGLDSAMFAHLKRNWSSSSGHSSTIRPSALIAESADGGEKTYEGTISYTQYLMNTTNPSSDTLSPKHRLAGLRNVKLSVYKPRIGTDGKTLEVPVGLVKSLPKGRKRKRDRTSSVDAESPLPKPLPYPSEKRLKPDSYQRELKMRKKSPRKPYYDEEDRAALRRMNKLRVDWSSAEDSFLLLCKVASCFLFPNIRSQMITFSIVRDMLHKRFPEARNKTSRACQRRINYIMKNPTTEYNVSNFLEEVRQDLSIVADFKGTKLPKNKHNLESIYATMFRSLVQRLVVKFGSSESRQCPDLPDTLDEFEERFKLTVAASSLRSKLKFKEVTSVEDIDFHVVNALIYSSLCSKHDRDSYAYQLYLAYQQYPQSLLNSVLRQMRHDQMISYKKCYNRSLFTQTCLPLSTSPFQLSMSYLHVFNLKYQYEIFHQAWQMLKRLYEKEVILLNKLIASMKAQADGAPGPSTVLSDNFGNMDSDEVPDKGVPVIILHEGGYCAAIVALMATKRLIFDIVIPEQIIMMDQQQHPLMDDQSQKLLRRFSSHTEMSGRQVNDVLSVSRSPETARKKDDHVLSENMDGLCASEGGDDGAMPSKRKGLGKDAEKVKRSKQSHDEMVDPLSLDDDQAVPSTVPDAEQSVNEGVVEDLSTPRRNVKPNLPKRSPSHSEGMNVKNDVELEVIGTEGSQETVQQPEMDASCFQAVDASLMEGEKTEVVAAQGRGPSASRLGLYMMRDQLSRAEVDQINIQHAQEHLVVNACDVTCRLRPPPELQESFEMVVPDKPEMVENFLLPLNRQMTAEALDHRRKVTLEGWTTLSDVMASWKQEGKSENLLQLVKDVYEYIGLCKEMGASIKDLKDKFNIPGVLNIMVVVNMMEEVRLLLRVGVAVVRWVTMHHTKPWLIHTNKLTRQNRQSMRLQGVYRMNLNPEQVTDTNSKEVRGCEKDSSIADTADETMSIQEEAVQQESSMQTDVPSNQDESSVGEDDSIQASGTDTACGKKEQVSRATRQSERQSSKYNSQNEENQQEGPSSVRHIHSFLAMRKRRYRRDEEASQEMEKTIKQQYESMDYEQISVAVRPWVRLNGTLNRRVLDRFLGAVLSLVMERPGISGTDVVRKFSPALQPAHTHDLLETLVQLGCVIREELIQSHKLSLFSDTVDYVLVPADIHDCDDDIIYEPTVDAIIRLSMFIGDKKYSQDFLSGDCR